MDGARLGWRDAVPNGWNGGKRIVGSVNRVPLDGLALVNQQPAPDPATRESAAGRAILYTPQTADFLQPIDGWLHLHGHGIGYRQRTASAPAQAGIVRDVAVDHIADGLAKLDKPFVAVLPQGSVVPTFGMTGLEGFDGNAFLDEVARVGVAAGVWAEAPTFGAVTLSAQCEAGETIRNLLQQPGQPRLPRQLRAIWLFQGLSSAGATSSLISYLTSRLEYDMLNIQNAMPDEDAASSYLRSSLQFQATYNPQDSVQAENHAEVNQALIAWFARNADSVGGANSPTYRAMRGNYTVVSSNVAPDGLLSASNLFQAFSAVTAVTR